MFKYPHGTMKYIVDDELITSTNQTLNYYFISKYSIGSEILKIGM
jgi:hypothetical protein